MIAPDLGPSDCRAADFTDIQSAINALPPGGGKIFVKAGAYIILNTIQIQASNAVNRPAVDKHLGRFSSSLHGAPSRLTQSNLHAASAGDQSNHPSLD